MKLILLIIGLACAMIAGFLLWVRNPFKPLGETYLYKLEGRKNSGCIEYMVEKCVGRYYGVSNWNAIPGVKPLLISEVEFSHETRLRILQWLTKSIPIREAELLLNESERNILNLYGVEPEERSPKPFPPAA